MSDSNEVVDEVPYGVGSGRSIEHEPQEPQGFLGKLANNAWNKIKSGSGTAAKWIGNSAVGKFGKWVWKNKVPIMGAVGGAMQVGGALTGHPALVVAGKGLSKLAGTIKEGEGKKALEREIAERQPNPKGDQSLTYSDMPRIHYSRKPAAYKNNLKSSVLSFVSERFKTKKQKK